MRKWLLALVGLLASASACYAAFAIFQTALPSRVQVNFSTYGGVCSNQVATRVTTITNSGSGLKDLAVTVNTFVSGDVGKTITIPGADSSGAFSSTIAAFVDAQHITLTNAAPIGISSLSTELTWGSDDSAAFLAFKAAFQGTTPVQLNLPTGMCVFIPVGGSPAFYTFQGVRDLIVSGNGAANTTLRNPNRATGSLALGGAGQLQNNRNSVRTLDANPSDSCVILKTTPAVTVSAITSNLPSPATFTGSISGTTLTASGVTGTIAIGATLGNVNSNTQSFTTVISQSTGPAGGAGTYVVSPSQTVASQIFSSSPASFTADFGVTTPGILTVTAVQDGTIAEGMFVYSNGGGIGAPEAIMPYGTSGTTGVGGTGTYKLNVPPASGSVTSRQMGGGGQPRVTLNSTTGLTTGDTLFTTGVSGPGILPQIIDGLRWIKVINGTQVDIFQSGFGGAYTSGGTGGGDRTALFPVGSTVLMTGWANQAYWTSPYGFPSNPGFFEYKKVTSTNSTTHQVCFDTPLIYTYKASWPQMNTGNMFEVDPGGPATLYVLDSSWEQTVEIKNLTLDVSGQTYANARTVTYRDIAMTGSNCISPTQNETHNWINVTGTSCQIETDKLVVNWNVTNASIRKVDIQSSSFVNVNVDGITTADGWFGSGKKMNMQNATIATTLAFGVTAYGASEESICSNCTSASLAPTGAVDLVNDSRTPWSMSGGVITIPNAYSFSGNFEYQLRNLVPGSYVSWIGTSTQHGAFFKVTGATQDLDNTYIQTSEVGGFPTGAWTALGLSISPHPAPKLTTSSMAGNNTSLSLNGCPAQSPMFSCQNFTYTGGAAGTTAGYLPTLWGALDTFTFTNNVPYTNSGSLTWQMSAFNNWPVLKTDLTQVLYGTSPNGQNILNTKLPSSCGSCTRTLTSGGATNTQAGDTITVPPTGALFGGTANSGPVFSANTPSDSPQVTVTLRTNQNLPP